MNKIELWYPIKPQVITQPFGVNGKWYQDHGIDIRGHNGIDFYAPDGMPVRAAHAGVVLYSGVDDFFGEYIEIVTMEACDVGGVWCYGKTVYVHFQHGGRLKAAGEVVAVGDIIGYADNTGLSTGSHLHFGLKRVAPDASALAFVTLDKDNGYFGAIDPTPYWNGYAANDIGKVYRGFWLILEKMRLMLMKLKI